MSALRKLTLSVDESVIRRARRYSEQHNTSISRLVTDFLARLGDVERGKRRYSTTVERLRGILPPETAVEEYHRHIEKRHSR